MTISSTNRSSPCPLTSLPDQAPITLIGGRDRPISSNFKTQSYETGPCIWQPIRSAPQRDHDGEVAQ